jgi:hypothetical protein
MRILIALLALLTGSLLSANEVRLRIVDENGIPIANAKTLIAFTTPVIGGEKSCEGLSDAAGTFSGLGQAVGSIFVRASKDGYYPARIERLPRDRDLDQTVVLPKIINPTPLYALDFRVGQGGPPLHFPIQNVWLGYDFEAGDWVSPYGKGKVTDIRFMFHHEFKGWNYSDTELTRLRQHPYNRGKSEETIQLEMGKWDGDLEISFPAEQEGLCEEQEHFLSYSRLKMPHNAPAEGYVPTARYESRASSPPSPRENVGFFLRTRVKLDKGGKIVSANYTKVMGDFWFGAQGFVLFTYYFNPTANDRNLEFDPKKNLFPANTPGAIVNDP